MYSVSQRKVAPPRKTLCDIFSPGERVYLKITLLVAQTYSHVYTNFGPFIWIFVWNVSLLTGDYPKISTIQFSLLRNYCIFRKNTCHIKWHVIKYNK